MGVFLHCGVWKDLNTSAETLQTSFNAVAQKLAERPDLTKLLGVLMVLHLCLEGRINSRYCSTVSTSKDQLDVLLACILLWSVGCPLCENSEAQWELCLFPHLPFHGASLRYFHLFWERRSIIRNATETTQAHTRTPILLHLSHQIVQGRKNFCDKARPTPWGNHIVQLDGVIW